MHAAQRMTRAICASLREARPVMKRCWFRTKCPLFRFSAPIRQQRWDTRRCHGGAPLLR